MRRSRGDYGGYRGRKTVTEILRIIAIGLGALVVLMLVVLLLGQKYIVFTDSGIRIPFLQGTRQVTDDPGSVSVVIQPASSHEEETPPVQPVEAEGATMAAIELPVQALLDGTAQSQLEEAGANGLILEMKNPQGQLGWVSQVDAAVAAEVNAQSEEINEILQQWNEAGEYTTIARVCCFRDNTIPYQRNNMALRASYGNWRDTLNLRWMNPANPDVQAYLVDLCEELAQLGFDEIVLDCCGFPSGGKLAAITSVDTEDAALLTQTMEDFLTQVEQALEPYDTVLSIQSQRETLTGENEHSGLTGALLESHSHRVWLEVDDEEPKLSALLTEAELTNPETRLVEIRPSLDLEADTAQGIFLEK